MQPKPKRLINGGDATAKLLEGVEIVYTAVSSTFGARSKNVAIARPFGTPSVVHDGVTVARELLPLADKGANVGAQLVADAADKTNKVGDGTTATTILTREIFVEANKRIAAGYRPMALREGIEDAVKVVAEALNEAATPITVDQVESIATVSAQNRELGEIVAQAFKAVGEDGVVTVEESRTTDTYMEVKSGMEFDKGFRSPHFITDPLLGEASVENVSVLVTNHKIGQLKEFAPVMEKAAQAGVKNYLIIADDIDGQALAFLAVNKLQGNINVIAVQAPSFGDNRNNMLRDIALVTNAKFIDKDAGMTLENVQPEDWGRAARVTSTKDSTVIVDGEGAAEDIEVQVAALKQQLSSPDLSAFDSERLQERLAKLTGGIAVIFVGAKSEPELKERKERAIDAISASKAALAEGIVPGGGIALLNARGVLTDMANLPSDPEKLAGSMIVFDACIAPFKKLMSNAGFDSGNKLAQLANDGEGIDVIDGNVKNMIDAGIIDPLTVIRSALQNAASTAVMLSTSDNIIVEADDEQLRGRSD